MTGGTFLGLILLSMAWLFFILGAALNLQAWRGRLKTAGRAVIPVLPGVAGSLAVFFTIPALARYGLEVPWPWLWILLPLFLDVSCLGGLLAGLLGRKNP
jgi:hypothetical protein